VARKVRPLFRRLIASRVSSLQKRYSNKGVKVEPNGRVDHTCEIMSPVGGTFLEVSSAEWKLSFWQGREDRRWCCLRGNTERQPVFWKCCTAAGGGLHSHAVLWLHAAFVIRLQSSFGRRSPPASCFEFTNGRRLLFVQEDRARRGRFFFLLSFFFFLMGEILGRLPVTCRRIVFDRGASTERQGCLPPLRTQLASGSIEKRRRKTLEISRRSDSRSKLFNGKRIE